MTERDRYDDTRSSNYDTVAAMIAGSPHPHILFGEDRRPIDCNESAAVFFDFASKNALLGGFADLLPNISHPDYEACLEKGLIRAIDWGSAEFEGIIVLAGESKEIKVSFNRVSLDDEQAVSCCIVDLTSLRRGHSELIRQDNLLQAINYVASILMMAGPDGFDIAIWKSLQMVGRTVRVDRAYIWENFEQDGAKYSRQIHEWSEGAEPQQGKDFAEALPYDEVPYWRDFVFAGRPLNSPVSMLPESERSVLEPQGIKSILVIPVMLEGQAWGYIGFDDCAEERFFSKIEEQMLVSGGTLIVSAIIRNRATDDLKEQIIAAKRASDANESKSNFLAKTSHEIRTPMNAIIGMAELALREEVSPVVRSHIADIMHAGNSLLAIINDILDFSKIESGRMEIVPVNYQLSSLINDAVSIIRTRAAKKGLAFTVDVDSALPDELYGDAVRIRQALINILDNAVKYTQAGYVNLEVSGERGDDGSVALTFAIRDSGMGIKPEDFGRLFQDFVQLDRQKNWGVVGTGLGLTISRSFLQAMGGDITVESEYGHGSTFYIKVRQSVRSELCVSQVGHVEEELGSASLLENAFTAPDAKILVVDDNETNLRVAVGLMKPYRLQVDTCKTGVEAVAMVERKGYDIVFMDHMMPEMDGIEATEIIRRMGEADDYFRNLPIIALTANAVLGMQEMFIERGMNGFLSKPIAVTKLHRELEKNLPAEKIVAKTAEAPCQESGTPHIFGLDSTIGVHRAGGSIEQYRDILSSYCAEGEKLSDAMRESLAENDLSRFRIYAHSLKSSSASIGAQGISDAAEVLERMGADMGRNMLEEKTDELLANLDSLIGDIRAFKDMGLVEAERGDESLLAECLNNILSALASFDLMAVDIQMSRLKDYAWPDGTMAHLDAVSMDLMLSDLDMAEERIRKLLGELAETGK